MVTAAPLSPRTRLIEPTTGLMTAEGFRYFQAITQAVSGGGTFQPLSTILTGLSGMGTGTGIVAQTAAATFLKRTLTATAPIQVTFGSGVGGDPLITVDTATDTASGVVELATNAETVTGTDTTRATTAAGVAAAITAAGAAYQPHDTDLDAWALVNPSAYLNTAGIVAAYQPLDADLTSWAGVTRAAGFDTFVTTPSSANLKTLVTDETGSGGALVFATSPTIATPTITGTLTAQGLIDASGALAGQVKFPASQNASADANTLDDYEEGTWTPAFTLTGVAFTSITYSAQAGYYEKIGRQVRIFGHITVSALTVGAASGNLTITGLPFAGAVFGAAVTIGFITSFTTNTPIHGAVGTGSDIALYHRTAITGGAVTSTFAVVSATSDIYFSATYHV